MDIKDIYTKKSYIKNGAEKVVWLNVGCLKTTEEGKQFVELNMFPGQGFYVFEKKEKAAAIQPTPIESNGQEIPF